MTTSMETTQAQFVAMLMARLQEVEASNLRLQRLVGVMLDRESQRPPLFIDLSGQEDGERGAPLFTFSDGWSLFWDMETGQCEMSADCTVGQHLRPLDEAHSQAIVFAGPLRIRFTPAGEQPAHVAEMGSQDTELRLQVLVDAVRAWGLQQCPAQASDVLIQDLSGWPQGTNGQMYGMQWFCGLAYDAQSSMWQLNFTFAR